MKKNLLSWGISLILAGILPAYGMAQSNGTPPTLSVNLVFNSSKYILNAPGDPIKAEITIRNTGTFPIITSAGFSQKPFHLFLVFTDPDGKAITAPELGSGVSEGGPPPIVIVEGVALQVEEVEILPVGFVKVVSIPDVRAFYPLTKTGRYSVKEIIAIRTYPAVTHVINGVNFASIDSLNFAGSVESNTVKFSIIADLDNDGYFSPEPPNGAVAPFTVPDCDDNDPTVNPGAVEIPGDGIDNDCNPATSPTTLDVAVQIDIKPGSFPNSINLGSKGTVPVAILSTATFDARDVDPGTVTLAGVPVAERRKGTRMASSEDVNKDGRLDLVVHVETQALALTLPAGDTEAVLLGKTFDVPGRPVFYIRGVDSVRVVP